MEYRPVLKPVEAAALLGISRYMLDEMVKRGKIPADCFFELPNVFGKGEKKRYRFLTEKILDWKAG